MSPNRGSSGCDVRKPGRGALAALLLALGCGGAGARPPVDPGSPPGEPDAAVAPEPDGPAVDAPPPDAEADRAPDQGPDTLLPAQAIYLSEVMYHPVLEDDAVDRHEFIELGNRGEAAVDLAGWKLTGDIDFTFPAGASIPGRGFAVVARDRSALAAVTAYGLTAASLHGDYARELDNGGGQVILLDPRGAAVDRVQWDDGFPWPLAADGMGAGAAWLPAAWLPLEQHRHRGVSLERIAPELPGLEVASWAPSPLPPAGPGPSPGRANRASGPPPAIVEALTAAPLSGERLVRASDEVAIRVRLSPGAAADPQVEYFVDDLERSDEARTVVAATGSGRDREARLPRQPDNSIVRYRVLADRGAGRAEVLSPRAEDPVAWHAYFVSPVISSVDPPYQLFIKSTDWGQLWTNIDHPGPNERRVVAETVGGQTVRCRIRPSWDSRVPAVFVSDGQVHDVRVRYQGSRWKRTDGRPIDLTRTAIAPLPAPMMARPQPDGSLAPSLSALSWNIDFPRYRRFEGERDTIIINKLADACPGLSATVGELLYRAAGLLAGPTRYRRLYLNGGYYAYTLDIESPSEGLLERQLPEGESPGDLFKVSGNQGVEEGPWGRGSLEPLPPSCGSAPPGYDALTRYAHTYERKTRQWKDASDIKALIDGLDAARRAGRFQDSDPGNDDPAPVRAFLAQTFDVPAVLTYLAVRNWALPWDDFFHNYYLYRDARGAWSILPWDLDFEFGEFYGGNVQRSFYVGEQGDPDGLDGREWNPLKDTFLRAYRPELIARLRALDAEGPLAPARWRPMVETAATRFDPGEAAASPVVGQCDFGAEKLRLLAFAEKRREALSELVLCSTRPCGLKGEYFRSPTLTPASLAFTRTDQVVDFDWHRAGPASDVPGDGFSVRWTGTITPPATGIYTFTTRSDDGVRLWLGTALLIDNWTVHPAVDDSATVPLLQGIPYQIRLEYYEEAFDAAIKLSWFGPGVSLQRVRAAHLQPSP